MNLCPHCQALFSVQLVVCPNCGRSAEMGEEAPLAWIRRNRGATIAHEDEPATTGINTEALSAEKMEAAALGTVRIPDFDARVSEPTEEVRREALGGQALAASFAEAQQRRLASQEARRADVPPALPTVEIVFDEDAVATTAFDPYEDGHGPEEPFERVEDVLTRVVDAVSEAPTQALTSLVDEVPTQAVDSAELRTRAVPASSDLDDTVEKEAKTTPVESLDVDAVFELDSQEVECLEDDDAPQASAEPDPFQLEAIFNEIDRWDEASEPVLGLDADFDTDTWGDASDASLGAARTGPQESVAVEHPQVREPERVREPVAAHAVEASERSREFLLDDELSADIVLERSMIRSEARREATLPDRPGLLVPPRVDPAARPAISRSPGNVETSPTPVAPTAASPVVVTPAAEAVEEHREVRAEREEVARPAKPARRWQRPGLPASSWASDGAAGALALAAALSLALAPGTSLAAMGLVSAFVIYRLGRVRSMRIGIATGGGAVITAVLLGVQSWARPGLFAVGSGTISWTVAPWLVATSLLALWFLWRCAEIAVFVKPGGARPSLPRELRKERNDD